MKLHLVIIDALNLIRRIHGAQGSPCTSGCLAALAKIINQCQPSHIVAVFDVSESREGWRYSLLPQYRSNRPPMPSSLQQEMPAIQESFRAAGIHCWQNQQNEACDIVATLASKMAATGFNATIISTDKSYCQLLAPQIQLRDYFQKRWLDLDFIEQHFGVQPCQLTDYWGLCGISSSKIPGVQGIGPMTAQQILQRFHNIEDAYAQMDKLAKPWRNRLSNNQQQALTCRQVATLQRTIQLAGNLNQLRYNQRPSA